LQSRLQQLKADVVGLQKSLAEITSSQAEMDKLRREEEAVFTKQKRELTDGLAGVKSALKVLTQYYQASGGAPPNGASAIISMLQEVESDFSKGLAEITATEENSVAEYKAETRENNLAQEAKSHEVRLKVKESTGLDEMIAEASSDKSTVEDELAAVKEYLDKLQGECVVKRNTFEQRKQHREQLIEGLRESLTILEGETAFLQQHSVRRTLRVSRRQWNYLEH